MLDNIWSEENDAQEGINRSQGIPDNDILYAANHLDKAIRYLGEARTDNQPIHSLEDARLFGRDEIENYSIHATKKDVLKRLVQKAQNELNNLNSQLENPGSQ